jgi:hypothetical protein
MLGVDLDGYRRIEPAHVGWPVGPDGSRRIQTDRLDDQMDDQGPSDNLSDGKASSPRSATLSACLDPAHRSHALLASAPALTGPAASRVVAEDAYQSLPVQHRVDQVTVEERDGVDVGQPWGRLDVEVGLSGQWRDGQDLVELGQPALGLG